MASEGEQREILLTSIFESLVEYINLVIRHLPYRSTTLQSLNKATAICGVWRLIITTALKLLVIHSLNSVMTICNTMYIITNFIFLSFLIERIIIIMHIYNNQPIRGL